MLVSKQKSQPSFQLFAANNKQMCTKTNFLNSFYDYAIKSFHLSPLLPQLPVFAWDEATWSLSDHPDIGHRRMVGIHTTSDLLLTPRAAAADFTFRFKSSVHWLKISGQTTNMIMCSRNCIGNMYIIKFIQSVIRYSKDKGRLERNVRYLMWDKSETPHWDCCRIIGGLKISTQPTAAAAATGSFP